ncbi:MAG: DNA primase [Lachnospiraceae bacterium]|nr:DNA primase [Lachnospiraceae bacterium]
MSPFEAVKQNTSARQVAEFYGAKVNKTGMCKCPFHSDKTPSMKIDNRFYCFGCNETGDAIDYVSKLFGIGLREAAIKICEDLSLEYDKTTQKTKPANRPIRPQKSEAQILAEAQKYIFKVLSDFRGMLKKWKKEYEPRSPDEEFHPHFVEALHKIDSVEYHLDTLLKGDETDRALLVSEQEKKVDGIKERLRYYKEQQIESDREYTKIRSPDKRTVLER